MTAAERTVTGRVAGATNAPFQRHPWLAYVNTALIFAPVALGLFAFRIWYSPAAGLRMYAGVVTVAYFVAAFAFAKWSSRARLWQNWRRSKPSLWMNVKVALGFVMFGWCSYHGFHAVAPAIWTQAFGHPFYREVRILSFRSAFRAHGCRYEITLDGLPTPLGKGFCLSLREANPAMRAGAIVVIQGRESPLGIRIESIMAHGASQQ